MMNDALKQALALAYEEKSNAYSKVPLPHPSSAFLQRTEQMAAKYKNRYVKVRHIYVRKAVAVAAMLALALAMPMSVKAVREKIRTFFIETFKEGSNINFQTETDTETPKEILEFYTFAVPEGFVLLEENNDVIMLKHVYKNQTGSLLYFSQGLLNANLTVNTEGVEPETVMVNGYDGLLVENRGTIMLVWRNDDYQFCLKGKQVDFTKEDFLNLAKTLKMQD